MAGALSENQRVYLQANVDGSSNPIWAATLPNTSGTATVGNSNAVNHIDCVLSGSATLLRNKSKTGTLSQLRGAKGRMAPGSWSLRSHMQGNGAAGVVPDIHPLLQATFGAKPTIVASTSVTYALADALAGFAIYKFISPSTETHSHQAVWGAMVESLEYEITGEYAEIVASGVSGPVIDRNLFASYDTPTKGGLSAFPSEPGSPVYNGVPVIGFTGSASFVALGASVDLLSMKVSIRRNVALQYAYGLFCPTVPSNGERMVEVSGTILDDDGAAVTAFKALDLNKTVTDITLAMGTTAGNIWTTTCKNVQFSGIEYDEGSQLRAIRFSGMANASSTTTRDELSLVIT